VSEKSTFEFMETGLYFELFPGLKLDVSNYLPTLGNFSMYPIDRFTYFVVIKYIFIIIPWKRACIFLVESNTLCALPKSCL
jgi:hypothetical protein